MERKLVSYNKHYSDRISFLKVDEYYNYSQMDWYTPNEKSLRLKESIKNNMIFGDIETYYAGKPDSSKKGSRRNMDVISEEKSQIRELLKFKETCYYNDDENIRKYYPDLFCSVRKFFYERYVSINDEKSKIKISSFSVSKTRQTLNPYFAKKEMSNDNKTSIILHLDTGNFYISNRSKESFVRCNNIKMLYRTCIRIMRPFPTYGGDSMQKWIEERYDNIYDLSSYNESLYHLIKQQNPDFVVYDYTKNVLFNIIFSYLLYKKKVKINDNNIFYYMNYYPGVKKKKNSNMFDEVLKKFKLDPKSKFLNKLLKTDHIKMEKLKSFVDFFGDDYSRYLSNLKNTSFFVSKTPDESYGGYRDSVWSSPMIINDTYRYLIDKKTKENVIKLLNDKYDKKKEMDKSKETTNWTMPFNISYIRSDKDLLSTIFDHLRMLHVLREFYPDISLTSTTVKRFNEEHSELSQLRNRIRKMFSVSYVYNENTINSIEEPIETADENDRILTFYPIILKNENDYLDEGNRMKHCVYSYTNKDTSMIISVRNPDDSMRVTCEYKIGDGKVIQERSLQNSPPPEEFKDALAILSVKVKEMASLGTLNWTKKEMIPNVINGKTIVSAINNIDNNELF